MTTSIYDAPLPLKAKDSFGQSATFQFVPSDGDHPSLVNVEIRNSDGTTVANLQYIGERHIARLFAALDSLMADPADEGQPIKPEVPATTIDGVTAYYAPDSEHYRQS